MPLHISPPAELTAKAVWEYATRELTRIRATPRTDLVGADTPIPLEEMDIGFPSPEALDDINVAAATPTTERQITVALPSGAGIRRVTLIALITAMNNSVSAQKIDVTVQGRVSGGAWNNYFSETDCMGFGAVDGATTGLVAAQDVTALVTGAGFYGFRCQITQSAAQSVRYTIQYILIVSIRPGGA
jgi:hypothetical protein